MQTSPVKLIVILGPTATGKTQLAVKLARKFNGEIISADSRQVYKYMNIGTGKDLGEYGKGKSKIKHHLIDIVKPSTEFNVAKFKTRATKAIEDIIKRGKVPFLVGGTGLYISAMVENYNIPEIKPDLVLRKKLEATPLSKLVVMLKNKNLNAYKKVDLKNKRRVIRAVEVSLSKKCMTRKTMPNGHSFSGHAFFYQSPAGRNVPYEKNIFILGMKIDRETIKQKIDQRVDRMIKCGLVREVKNLHEKYKVPWKKLESFGMEYKYPALFLRGKISKDEMIERIKITNRQFAKRQMTWFRGMEKRGVNINWIQDYKQAYKLIARICK